MRRLISPLLVLFGTTILTACGDTDKKKPEKPFEGPAVINEKVTARDLILNDSLAKTKVVPFNERSAGQKDMVRDEVARAAIAAEMEAARAVMLAREERNDSIRRAEQEEQEKMTSVVNPSAPIVEKNSMKETPLAEKPQAHETGRYGGVMNASWKDTATTVTQTVDTAEMPPRPPVRPTNIGKRISSMPRVQ